MNYFLDTNICIHFLNGSLPIKEKLGEIGFDSIKIPSVVVAELFYGASKSAKREHNFKRVEQFISMYEVIPFEYSSAHHYGDIRASLERQGKPIGWNDYMIAATTLANNGILVTNNTGEFSRINELILEDWTE